MAAMGFDEANTMKALERDLKADVANATSLSLKMR